MMAMRRDVSIWKGNPWCCGSAAFTRAVLEGLEHNDMGFAFQFLHVIDPQLTQGVVGTPASANMD